MEQPVDNVLWVPATCYVTQMVTAMFVDWTMEPVCTLDVANFHLPLFVMPTQQLPEFKIRQ